VRLGFWVGCDVGWLVVVRGGFVFLLSCVGAGAVGMGSIGCVCMRGGFGFGGRVGMFVVGGVGLLRVVWLWCRDCVCGVCWGCWGLLGVGWVGLGLVLGHLFAAAVCRYGGWLGGGLGWGVFCCFGLWGLGLLCFGGGGV